MRVVCIIQARLGSQRFPCKILADLCGKPMLMHVLERAEAIDGVDQVVLAVPQLDVPKLKHLWPYVSGGPERDVLSRYAFTAKEYGADVIVRITGDCPLLAPDCASKAVAAFTPEMMAGGGYVALCQPYSNVPDGWDAEVFSIGWLNESYLKAGSHQREHVVTWMREHHVITRVPIYIPGYKNVKWSVDAHEDLVRVRRVMEFLNDPLDYSGAATWEAWQRAGRP